ncbi:glycosyltransferase family 2 protein [Bacillus sp. EB93]|nr:glycosyltransferase family 2 protein [Peribacillus frigoritolerans]
MIEDVLSINTRKVIILIPIHNGVNETLKCLDSVYQSTYSNIDVIIIDDGSTDDSQKIISEKYNKVKFLNGDGSLWWSGGMNEGLKYVIGNYEDEGIVILLNNDNIIKSDMIEILVKSVRMYSNSIICSKVYIEGNDEQILFAGGLAKIRKSGLYINGYYETDREKFNKMIKVDWCGGMGVAIPLNIVKDVGYFDNKNFPQYFGDADYMFRARRKGYQIIYDPSSICWNNRDQTGFSIKSDKVTWAKIKVLLFNIKSNYDLKSNFRFYLKYFGFLKGTSILCLKYFILLLSLSKKAVFSVNSK